MLTESKFLAIVAMIRGGATDEIIMTSQGINESTLKRVKASDGDFEKYRKLHGEFMSQHGGLSKGNSAKKARQEVQVIEHRDTVMLVANNYVMAELKEQTKMLTLISNKLTNIMENMESVKEAWQ